MVCLRNICVNTLRKGGIIFTNNNNNNNNNKFWNKFKFAWYIIWILLICEDTQQPNPQVKLKFIIEL
jgi:hypothetical protein